MFALSIDFMGILCIKNEVTTSQSWLYCSPLDGANLSPRTKHKHPSRL
jgi:hypothetical protein